MKITKIEARKPLSSLKKKVAAYARVSMVTDKLERSLSAQISYYSKIIQSKPDWEYAGVYADNGISGTSAKERNEFQRLLSDCKAGQIDIVLTKSISRFARNTLELLDTVHHLKDIGVEVWFEKENICTFSKDGELMLTLLASFAQNESENISKNVKWGIRKRFEKGIPHTHKAVYGYHWEGDELVIVPEEAAIIKRIYQNFLDGKSRLETEREFAAEGIETRAGGHWVDSNLGNVLRNEIYTGALCLQKTFKDGPLTRGYHINKGQLPRYWVPDHHEAIIDKEIFDSVQREMQRRRDLGQLANKSLNTTCFTGKIKCEICGSSLMHNPIHRKYGSPYITWECGTKKKKGHRCPIRAIPEVVLKRECAAVLGTVQFDETIFLQKIDHIGVPENHVIVVYFKDGTTIKRHWISTALQESWTEERKVHHKKSFKEALSKSSKYSPFTTRIKCSTCGDSLYRSSAKSPVIGNFAKWVHRPGYPGCGRKSIREERLKSLAAKVMGVPEFDGETFKAQVECIVTNLPLEIKFIFKDGREVIVNAQSN